MVIKRPKWIFVRDRNESRVVAFLARGGVGLVDSVSVDGWMDGKTTRTNLPPHCYTDLSWSDDGDAVKTHFNTIVELI